MKTLLKQKATQRLALTLGVLALYGLLVIIKAPVFKTPSERIDTFVRSEATGLLPRLSFNPIGVSNAVGVKVTELSFVSRTGQAPDSVCLSLLVFVYYGGPGMADLAAQTVVDEEDPVCYELEYLSPIPLPDYEEFREYRLKGLELPADDFLLPIRSDSVWYPYDGFRLTVRAEATYHAEEEGQSEEQSGAISGISVDFTNTSSWIAAAHDSLRSDVVGAEEPDDPFTTLELRFRRPLFDQLVFPAVVIIMLVLILLLAFVDSLSTFIEGAVAVFFSMFGITQILKPSVTEVRTLVDIAIWGLYFGVAGILLHHLLVELGKWLHKYKGELGDQSDTLSEQGELHTLPPATPPPPSESTEPTQPELAPANARKAASLLILSAIASFGTWLLWKARLRQ
jgi:hypothetical protein